jgi:hypothetical protein
MPTLRVALTVWLATGLLFGSAHAQTQRPSIQAKDMRDVVLRTGKEVLPAALELMKKYPDIAAAAKEFETDNMKIVSEGLTLVSFRRGAEQFQVLYIPYAPASREPDRVYVVVFAQGPKGTQVVAAVAQIQANQPPQVLKDVAVKDGKSQPSSAFKDWLKCAGGGCVIGTVGCAFTDGLFLACTAVTCPVVATVCWLNNLW